MELRLEQIGTLFTGVGPVFLKKLNKVEEGDTQIITLSNLHRGIEGETTKLNTDFKPTEYLQDGDIIVKTRGNTNPTYLYREEGYKTIAQAPIIIFRPDRDKVIPEFLQWQLNTEEIQRGMPRKDLTRGKAVYITQLENVWVKVPSLEVQRKIIEMRENVEKEVANMLSFV